MRAIIDWLYDAFRNRIVALLLFSVILVPLAIAPLTRASHTSDALAYEALGVALLVLLVWQGALRVGREAGQDVLRTGVHLPVLLYLAWACTSIAWAPNKLFAIQEALRLGTGALVYAAVATRFRRSDHLVRLADVLILVAIAASLFGLIQNATFPTGFMGGPFGDHQLFGSFLAALLPFIVTLAVTEKSTARQLAAQCAAVLVAAALLLAHGRSAWVGAGVGLVVLAGISLAGNARRLKREFAQRKHEWIVPALLPIAAIGVFLLLTTQSSSIMARAGSLVHIEKEQAWTFRQDHWQTATEILRAHPLTGLGVGQFLCRRPLFLAAKSWTTPPHILPDVNDQAHNTYLQTAAEIGFPGLLLYAAILVTFFVRGVRNLQEMESGIRSRLLLGSLAAVAAITADGLASPSWQFSSVAFFLWLALGIGTACQAPRREKARSPAPAGLGSRIAAVACGVAMASLLPTTAVSSVVKNPYVSHLVLEPRNAQIRAGAAQEYTLYADVDNGVEYWLHLDISMGGGTDGVEFTVTKGAGSMVGPNHRVYQSTATEQGTVTITATSRMRGDRASTSTHLMVR